MALLQTSRSLSLRICANNRINGRILELCSHMQLFQQLVMVIFVPENGRKLSSVAGLSSETILKQSYSPTRQQKGLSRSILLFKNDYNFQKTAPRTMGVWATLLYLRWGYGKVTPKCSRSSGNRERDAYTLTWATLRNVVYISPPHTQSQRSFSVGSVHAAPPRRNA